MDKHEQAYASRNEALEWTRYRGSVALEQVEGVGPMWRVLLWTVSEDGPQREFTGLYAEREDADLLLSAWLVAETRRLVWLAARLEYAS
jgi:hypothetical protein